jgi:hypothetical protein
MTRDVYWKAQTLLEEIAHIRSFGKIIIEDKVTIKGGQESLVLSEALCTLFRESCKERLKVLQEEFDSL